MKMLQHILSIILLLVVTTCFADEAPYLVVFSVSSESGHVTYADRTNSVTRTELSGLFARVSSIDKSARLAIIVPLNITFDVIADLLTEMKSLGLEQVDLIYGEKLQYGNSDFDGVIHIDFNESIFLTEKDKRIDSTNNAQQGGPGYPPQGVGSPDP